MMRIRIGAAFLVTLLILQVVPAYAGEQPPGEVKPAMTTVGLNDLNSTSEGGLELLTEDQAVKIFSQVFPSLCQGKNFTVEFQDEDINGHPSWRINLKGYGDFWPEYNDAQELLGGVVDAITGEITGFHYRPDLGFYRGKKVSLTREQAGRIAGEFVRKMLPDKISQLTLNPTSQEGLIPGEGYHTYYSFTWQRLNNSILVDWDSVRVGVDAYSGLVTSYNYCWHDMELPEVSKVIAADKIMDDLLDEIGLFLAYTRFSTHLRFGDQLQLIYQLNTTALFVDARSGNWLDSRGQIINPADSRIYNQTFNMINSGAVLSDNQSRNLISYDEARSTAQEFFHSQGLKGEVRKSGGGRGPDGQDEYWYFSLENTPDNIRQDLSVMIDAYSGMIKGFSYHGRLNPVKGEPLTYEQALTRARAVIEKYHPKNADQIVLNKNWQVIGEPEGRYYFRFTRLLNGIPLENDDIIVVIDGNSGKVVEYQVDWHPVKSMSAVKLLDEKRARQIFKDRFPLELVYAFPWDEGTPAKGAILVYRIPAFQRLNAVTGEVFDRLMVNKPDVTKLTLQTADPALSLLAENGLLLDRQFVNPVTRREALKALIAATNPRRMYARADDVQLHIPDIDENDPDLLTFKLAVKRGIIPDGDLVKAEQGISREEWAEWVVKALGYEEIASNKISVAVPFRDASKITPSKSNFVGLAYGLNVVGADKEGYFHPDKGVKWSDLAASTGQIAVSQVKQ
ncbi:PepSY domain-containing protein [Syntrophomonas erecta]